MPTNNTGVVSPIPPHVACVKENAIDEEGNGNHLIKSISLEKTQSPVSGKRGDVNS